jgi:hypothetical protein
MNEKLHLNVREQVVKHLQSYWLKPSIFTSRELYGQLTRDMPRDEVLKTDKDECLLKFKDIFTKMPWLEQIGPSLEYCQHEIETLFKRVKDRLPATLQVPPKEIENDQTVEIEQEMKSETNKENQTQLENQAVQNYRDNPLAIVASNKCRMYPSFSEALKVLNAIPETFTMFPNSEHLTGFSLDAVPLFPLNSFLEYEYNKLLLPYKSAFEGIYLSFNVLEWTGDRDYYALLGNRRTDFHHLLVKDSQVTLLSQWEADYYVTGPYYYNLTLGFNDPKKKPSKDEAYKIVKLKFLNGDSQFTKDEIALLKIWFKSQGIEKMKKLYLQMIIAGYPEKIATYKNSTLQQLFQLMQEANS